MSILKKIFTPTSEQEKVERLRRAVKELNSAVASCKSSGLRGYLKTDSWFKTNLLSFSDFPLVEDEIYKQGPRKDF